MGKIFALCFCRHHPHSDGVGPVLQRMQLKIIVCVKQLLDPGVPLEIAESECQVLPKSPDPIYIINPADRCALEEGMRLANELSGSVSVVTVGPSRARSALRFCLARGADRAIHLAHDDGVELDAWSVAVILAHTLRREDFNLVLCGEKSLDDNAAQVGPALSELLDLPQVTRAIGVDVSVSTYQLTAQRLLERGDREVVTCPLPAVVSVSPHINEPSYVPIRAQLAIRDEFITELEINSLLNSASRQLSVLPLTRITRVAPPRLRPKKIFTPDSSLSAMERIRLITGGHSQRKSARIKDSPEKAAEQIIDFLKEHGIISHS